MKILNSKHFVIGLGLLSLQAIACEYKAFDLEVVEAPLQITTRGVGSKGVGEAEASDPLAFAKSVVTDATVIHSDGPFMDLGSGLQWKLDPTDSALAKNMTMVEIYGYFKDYIKAEIPPNFLSTANMEKFMQLSAQDILQYPQNADSDRISIVESGVRKAFGTSAENVLTLMRQKNQGPQEFGVKHFSRPSVLSSRQTVNTHGDSTLMACLAVAYSRDLYVNQNLSAESKEQLSNIGMRAIRSLILDRMAAEAITLKGQQKPVNAASVMFGGGQMSCGLQKNNRFKLKPRLTMRCLSVIQGNPVLRRIPNHPEERLVQVGDELYDVSCDLKTEDRSSIGAGFAEDLGVARPKRVLLSTQAGLESLTPAEMYDGISGGFGKSPLAASFKQNFSKIKKSDASAKDFVLKASNDCDKEINKPAVGGVQAPAPRKISQTPASNLDTQFVITVPSGSGSQTSFTEGSSGSGFPGLDTHGF